MGSVGNFSLIGSQNDPEITDNINDYYLPANVRNKLSSIKDIKTYNDFKSYMKNQGIEVDTGLDKLKSRGDENIPAVADLQQKIITAIETYKSVYGKDSLSSLKKIVLYDQDLDTRASYHFNLKGENDPLAGTIRFRDWNVSGRDVYHELAHAVQDSMKGKNDDVITYTNKLATKISIPRTAYSGSGKLNEDNAERMAEALAFGFSRGTKNGKQFINEFRRYRRK